MWEIKLRVCDSFVWKTLNFLDGNGGCLVFCLESKLENPVKSFFEPLKDVAMSKIFMSPFFNRPRLQKLETYYIQWDVFV